MTNTARATRPWSWKGVAGLALALAVFGLSPRSASALLVSMPTYTQNPGDTLTVSVSLTASPAITLDGYTLHIGFDPTKLAYLGNAGLGVFSGRPEFSINATPTSNQTGTLIFFVSDDGSTQNTGIPLANNATVTLLTFQMQLKAGFTTGSTPLTFLRDANDTISDNVGNDNTFASGALTATNGAVTAVPEPSQFALLGLLGALGGARLAWRRRRPAA